MRIYRIKGHWGHGVDRAVFSKEIVALSELQAVERVYSELGSRHKLKRSQICIGEVKEIKPEDVADKKLREMVGKWAN